MGTSYTQTPSLTSHHRCASLSPTANPHLSCLFNHNCSLPAAVAVASRATTGCWSTTSTRSICIAHHSPSQLSIVHGCLPHVFQHHHLSATLATSVQAHLPNICFSPSLGTLRVTYHSATTLSVDTVPLNPHTNLHFPSLLPTLPHSFWPHLLPSQFLGIFQLNNRA